VRRRLASNVAEAGRNPTIVPASPEVSRNPRPLMWAAASLVRRRPLLWFQFWPGSCPGFMLQPHEPLVACCCARIAVRRFDCTGDDLHASGKGRHQDLFRPSNSRRPTHRLETRAGLLGARIIGKLEPATRAGSGRFPLPELQRYARERFDIHQSRDGAHLAGDESQCASIRYRDHDGRRPVGWAAWNRQLHDDCTGESGHTYRIGDHYRPLRQRHVQREFVIPCHASRVEFPGRSEPAAPCATAASHATLTTACTAGGQHGG
jgi:hypothetical protein